MARPDASKFQTVRDDEIMVDRDGIPHYTGVMPHLMKEYKQRVLFAFAGLEGDGETEEKEAADLQKKQRRFAKRLIDALHGEAWTACQDLLKEPEKLRVPKGYEMIFQALGMIEKETIIRKTEAFEKFFDCSYRKRGQTIDSYLREKKQAWRELRDLDEASNMSEDLQAYFLLRGCNLSRDDRRSILLANRSSYTGTGIEQALRISFHDQHEKERYRAGEDRSPAGRKVMERGNVPMPMQSTTMSSGQKNGMMKMRNKTMPMRSMSRPLKSQHGRTTMTSPPQIKVRPMMKRSMKRMQPWTASERRTEISERSSRICRRQEVSSEESSQWRRELEPSSKRKLEAAVAPAEELGIGQEMQHVPRPAASQVSQKGRARTKARNQRQPMWFPVHPFQHTTPWHRTTLMRMLTWFMMDELLTKKPMRCQWMGVMMDGADAPQCRAVLALPPGMKFPPVEAMRMRL